MQIPQINIEDYNFFLPEEKIAQFPLTDRDKSKLLFADCSRETIFHQHFFDIADIMPADSLLIRNDTKVFPARLFVLKPTGGNVEILIESPASYPEPQLALRENGPQVWLCTVRGKNLDEGLLLEGHYHPQNSEQLNLHAKILQVSGGKRLIEFDWSPSSLSFAEFLAQIGKVPLPPYIHRQPVETDSDTYQTVFAKVEGSIAAPTAGLHFTPQVMQKILHKGITTTDITLHVGSGTFVPMKTDKVEEHKMHSEQFSINVEQLKVIHSFLKFNEENEQKKRIIATGTTTTRTLETLYWLGKKIYLEKELDNHEFHQWDWIELTDGTELLPSEAIECLINYLEKQSQTSFLGSTSLFIVPGYDFKIINGLITNFHLPKSTLLLLIASFAEKDFYRMIYDEALSNDYRFLSYGDSSMIFR
jgi:S-adenosylmethionine:tRNA ribosyltransferase-isomerase